MVYLWNISDDYPSNLIGRYQRNGTPDRFLFTEGKVIAEPLGVPIFNVAGRAEQVSRFSNIPNSADVPLVNSKLGRLLSLIAGSDIQLIPAKVITSDGTTLEYELINVTAKVKGIDHEKSKYSYVPGSRQIMRFQKLVYRHDCLKGHHLARDSEYLGHLLVSEELVSRLRELAVTGVSFDRPESESGQFGRVVH